MFRPWPLRQKVLDLDLDDFFEIDFLDVESVKSGDAIAIRYEIAGRVYVHVVDGGYQQTGESVVKHIKTIYGSTTVDNVVATHPDGDHAGGLRSVLQDLQVGALWMHRPWLYAEELLPRFARFTTVDGLAARLKLLYPNILALEELANARGVPIYEAFQGTHIGAFTVMAPSRASYLNLVVASEKTPDEAQASSSDASSILMRALEATVNFVRGAWGEEVFSNGETSAENAMSVVQYAYIANQKILLTADTGRDGLNEAADYAPYVGLTLPGIDRFQVPHHGSRRNVSTETLDRWLGERLAVQSTHSRFQAVISAAKADTKHPRKAVVRAMIHRGATVYTTEECSTSIKSPNAPARGWGVATPAAYPEDQES
jgi:beta-lactamase superfamily II metal-dependent hydrolase